jgi:hypothetical protein
MASNPSTLMRSNKPQAIKTSVIAASVAGKPKAQIARELGIAVNTVTAILRESELERIQKDSSPEQVLNRAGLTKDFIAEKLREGTAATEVKLATFEGKFTDRLDVPDNSARYRNIELAAKIHGMLPTEQAGMVAQLFVRLPEGVLTAGHPKTCTCAECCKAWESIPNAEVVDP